MNALDVGEPIPRVWGSIGRCRSRRFGKEIIGWFRSQHRRVTLAERVSGVVGYRVLRCEVLGRVQYLTTRVVEPHKVTTAFTHASLKTVLRNRKPTP